MEDKKTKKEKEEKEEKTKIENEKEAEKKEKGETKNPKKKAEIKPKEKAIARGISINASPKYCFAICRAIKGKTPEQVIETLNQVIKKKKPIPMKGEIGHRKGIMSGRYPKKATLEFINIIKQLRANAINSGIENPVIIIAKANKASRPYRREGKRAKRTHIYLEARNKAKLKEKTGEKI